MKKVSLVEISCFSVSCNIVEYKMTSGPKIDTSLSLWPIRIRKNYSMIYSFSHVWQQCRLHNKENTWLRELSVLGEKIKRGQYVFNYFSRYVQPRNWKGLGESFPLIWLNIGIPWKITKILQPRPYYLTLFSQRAGKNST